MYDLAILGEKDAIMGFKALGLKIYDWSGIEEQEESNIKRIFLDIYNAEHKIIFITEKYFMLIENILAEREQQVFPVVIPIPNPEGSQGIGLKRLREYVIKAVGADIFAEKE